MSILYSLRKYIDANQHRLEEAKARIARERPKREDSGGKPPLRYRCRICETEADDATYCPVCLADTMEVM